MSPKILLLCMAAAAYGEKPMPFGPEAEHSHTCSTRPVLDAALVNLSGAAFTDFRGVGFVPQWKPGETWWETWGRYPSLGPVNCRQFRAIPGTRQSEKRTLTATDSTSASSSTSSRRLTADS